MPDQTPAVTPDSSSPFFSLPDAAADAVSKIFGGNSGTEQAAVIFRRPDGSHVYSTVAPQVLHDKFALRAQMPAGYKLSGIVHSHPGDDDDGQQFSSQDLDTATKLGVPSYVRFLRDNSIRKYVPGQTHTSFMGTGFNRQKVAHGDPLTAEPAPQSSPLQQATGQTDSQPTGALAALQQQ